MLKARLFGVLVGIALIGAVVSSSGGPVYAEQGPASASCYWAMRTGLGTVLPSGYRGYLDAGTCSAVERILRPPAQARAGCLRQLREELQTVLPGRGSGFEAVACAVPHQLVTR